MPSGNGRSRWLALLPVAALITAALPVAPAAADLPRTYNATRIDSGAPTPGGAFGWGLYSGDVTGDGKQDLLVAQGQVGTAEIPNKVFVYSGATARSSTRSDPPEANPPNADGSYQSPEMAFVYVETMPDLGSCPAGDGADAGKICDNAIIGPKDGAPRDHRRLPRAARQRDQRRAPADQRRSEDRPRLHPRRQDARRAQAHRHAGRRPPGRARAQRASTPLRPSPARWRRRRACRRARARRARTTTPASARARRS